MVVLYCSTPDEIWLMMSSLFLYSVILSTGGYPPVAVQVSVVVWVAGRELLSAVNSVNGVSIHKQNYACAKLNLK